MSEQRIAFEKENNIANIAFPRIGTMGLVSFADELFLRCNQINQDDEIRVVTVTGTDTVFFDPVEFPDHVVCSRITGALASIRCPLIAAINGDAIGFGLSIALTCDIRITVESARFGFDEVSRGEMPCGGGSQRLPRIVGKGKALELILTARIIGADEAWRIGLANQICPAAELGEAVNNLALKISSKGPISERYAKEAISKGMDMTLGQGLGLEADLSFLLQSTSDRTEGINAFNEKRTPEFKGN